MPSSRSSSLVLAISAFLAVSPSAHAYLDGGSGSYLLQMLAAGVLGGVFMLKNAVQYVKAGVARRVDRSASPSGHSDK